MNYITTEARPPVLSHVSFTTVDEVTVVLPSADLLLTRCHSSGETVCRVFPDPKSENSGYYEISETEFNRIRRLLTEAPTSFRPAPEKNVSHTVVQATQQEASPATHFTEGYSKKGGVNPGPTTARPAPPKGSGEGRFHG